ncbi:hypothetical protein [Ascidiaceihabitans sp.]
MADSAAVQREKVPQEQSRLALTAILGMSDNAEHTVFGAFWL